MVSDIRRFVDGRSRAGSFLIFVPAISTMILGCGSEVPQNVVKTTRTSLPEIPDGIGRIDVVYRSDGRRDLLLQEVCRGESYCVSWAISESTISGGRYADLRLRRATRAAQSAGPVLESLVMGKPVREGANWVYREVITVPDVRTYVLLELQFEEVAQSQVLRPSTCGSTRDR